MNKDEAIQVIRSNYPTGRNQICEALETLIPELKESDDEKIRKTLKSFFDSEISDYGNVEWRNGIRYGEIVSWLEKQSKQKPTNKFEPKFKVGDWVVSPNGVYWHIDSINNNRYEVSSTNGACADWPLDTDLYHFWTIQDAKDGDVLVASDGSIFIFKEIEDCGCKHYIALEKDSKTIKINDNLKHFWESIRGVKPATKEQRDLLFQKMKEAGYVWDTEKKEFKMIEQKFKSGDFIADGKRVFLVLANTEERNLGETYSTYCEGLVLNVYGDVLVDGKDFSGFRLATDIERANFVHDLKVGVKINYKSAVWNEQDDEYVDSNVHRLMVLSIYKPTGKIKDDIVWLKSLKQRMKGE